MRDCIPIGFACSSACMVFFIDASPVDEGGEPQVRTPEAELYGPAHKTHTLGGGRVCLADSLRGWDLTRILFQCDSWARGYEIYKRTGRFPKNPRQSFSPRAQEQDASGDPERRQPRHGRGSPNKQRPRIWSSRCPT